MIEKETNFLTCCHVLENGIMTLRFNFPVIVKYATFFLFSLDM
jgi:hypothetical protein